MNISFSSKVDTEVVLHYKLILIRPSPFREQST